MKHDMKGGDALTHTSLIPAWILDTSILVSLGGSVYYICRPPQLKEAPTTSNAGAHHPPAQEMSPDIIARGGGVHHPDTQIRSVLDVDLLCW